MRSLPLLLALAACAAVAPNAVTRAGVALEGNRGVPARDLLASARRELDSFEKHGRRPADAADAAYAMELLLRDEGYAQGHVDFEVGPEQVFFRVDEGPLAHLAAVHFEGVRGPDAEEKEKALRRFFDYKGTGLLDRGPPLFRMSEVEGSASQVERFYLLRGHLRVRVDPPDVAWNGAKDAAEVTIRIEEGRAYRVETIDFGEGEPLPGDFRGRPYHVRVPVELAAQVRREWLDRGRQHVKVEVEPEIDDATGAVTLHVRVDPGPVVHAGEVLFEGQDRTREEFLRRRFRVREGDALLQEMLDGGLDNLYRSGLFRTVRVEQRPTAHPAVSDLAITLEELPARSVDLEVGYGSYEQARGAVRYRDRNLLGLGRRFSAEVSGSLRSRGIDLGFEDPWILGPRDVVDLGVGYLVREEPSFDLTSYHFDAAVRHRFPGPYVLRAGYEFRTEEARNVTGDISSVDTGGFLTTAGIFALLRRDTRDAVLVPSSGSLSELGVRWSSPLLGADLDFLELSASAARYLPVGERTVLAMGLRFRSREVLDASGTLPIQERLFLGGESSVRSFRESELGPADAQGDPLGGLTSAEAGIELRHRLWRELHGAIFYDVGIVSPEAFSLQGPPGHAIGFGLRYLFPVGPLRVDFGWNPGPRFAASGPWALHFAFGFSF